MARYARPPDRRYWTFAPALASSVTVDQSPLSRRAPARQDEGSSPSTGCQYAYVQLRRTPMSSRFGPVASGPNSLESVRRVFEGSWDLVSAESYNATGQPVVLKGKGRLTYDAEAGQAEQTARVLLVLRSPRLDRNPRLTLIDVDDEHIFEADDVVTGLFLDHFVKNER